MKNLKNKFLQNKFLQKIAKNIYENHIDDLSKCLIVLPNYRLLQMLYEAFASLKCGAMWMPHVLTIDGVVRNVSSLQQTSSIQSIELLIGVYNKISHENVSFEDFYFLGKRILQDFNYLDKFCISIDDLEIEYYSRKKFLPYSDFISLYKEYNGLLAEKRVAYTGMCYKDAADVILSDNFFPSYTHVYVVGLEDLAPVEEKIISAFSKKCDVKFFSEDYKSFSDFSSSAEKTNFECKKIETLECQTRSAQIDVVVCKIQEIFADYLDLGLISDSKVAIILKNTDLFLPLVSALPVKISDLDIDVKFSISCTKIFGLIKNFISLYLYQRDNDIKVIKLDFVEEILQSSLFVDCNDADFILKKIKRCHNIYMSIDELCGGNSFFYRIFFIEKEINLVDYLMSAIRDMYHIVKTLPTASLEITAIEAIESKINELNDCNKDTKNVQAFADLVVDILKDVQIPIRQKVNYGLTMCSLEEIVCLEYDHVFVLDASEGNYSQERKNTNFIIENHVTSLKSKNPSFIDSVKQIPKEEYLFYRLLQSVKNIYFLYDATSSEMSRYVLQFSYLFPQLVIKNAISTNVSLAEIVDIVIDKDDVILQELDKFNVNQNKNPQLFTPSAINTYIDCSLKFYLRYIKKLKSETQRESLAIKAMFGTVLHKIMEKVYAPFVDKSYKAHISKDDIALIIQKLDSIVDAFFAELFLKNLPNDVGDEGYNILAKEIMKKAIKNILLLDSRYAPFVVVGVEHGRDGNFFVDHKISQELIIRIGGVVDRIDFKDSVFRILDYKTGVHANRVKDLLSVFDGKYASRNGVALQLFLYSWILYKSGLTFENKISPHIVNIRQIFSQKSDLNIYIKGEKNYEPIIDLKPSMEAISVEVDKVIKEIFDAETPFCQTANTKICATCEYARLCNR